MSRSTSRPPAKNRLLEALPPQDLERLLAHGAHVELDIADVLCEADERIRYVFFPTGGSISLITPAGTGTSREVGRIGDEGMLGLPLVFGSKVAPLRAVVQESGAAWRFRAAPFCRELERSLPLRGMLKRYLHVRLRLLAQTALCAQFHVVNERLARCLLTTSDHVHSDQFYITQKSISTMLGVRREGVNHAASLLQKRNLIRYTRGHLTILDRRGLEAAACACYAVDKEVYASVDST